MRDKRQALAQAKSHEAGGRADEAARAYLSAGSLSDAVRVLVEAKRYLDAGNLVMRAVGATPETVQALNGQKRRLAHRAALYFVSAGKLDAAMTILEGLGDTATLEKVRRRAAMSAPPPASEPPARLSDPGMRPMTPPPPRSGPPGSSPPPRASSTHPAPSGRAPESHAPPNQLELARRLEAQGQLALAKQAYVRLKRFADAGFEPTIAYTYDGEGGKDKVQAAMAEAQGQYQQALEQAELPALELWGIPLFDQGQEFQRREREGVDHVKSPGITNHCISHYTQNAFHDFQCSYSRAFCKEPDGRTGWYKCAVLPAEGIEAGSRIAGSLAESSGDITLPHTQCITCFRAATQGCAMSCSGE